MTLNRSSVSFQIPESCLRRRVVTLGAAAAVSAVLVFLVGCGNAGTPPPAPVLSVACSDCPTTAPTCAGLADALQCLKTERADLQEQLKSASPGEKPPIAACIKQINVAIRQLNAKLSTCSASPLCSTNQQAVGLTWGGYVDLDLPFANFFNSNHTVAARFMFQYPRGYAGPIVAENGSGTYVLGQGPYRLAGSARKLMFQIGSQMALYTEPLIDAFAPGRWNHLAVVRTGDTFKLYFNGKPLCASNLSTCDIIYTATAPVGNLRLGRRTDGQLVIGSPAQFYGFIDDVAVFNRALSATELSGLASSLALSGTESGLVAGWTFDAPGSAPAPLTNHQAQLGSTVPGVTAANRFCLSSTRNGIEDSTKLPLPQHLATHRLPFANGLPFRVLQGYDQTLSHNDYAVFSFDFVRADVPSQTCDQPFYATATGTVFEVNDEGDTTDDGVNGIDAPNVIRMFHNAFERATYMHHRTGTWSKAHPDLLFLPQFIPVPVAQGDWLANIGTRGPNNCHLHMGTADRGSPSVGIPMAFSNYEASDDGGKSWYPVKHGVPKYLQWIRNTGVSAAFDPQPDLFGVDSEPDSRQGNPWED